VRDRQKKWRLRSWPSQFQKSLGRFKWLCGRLHAWIQQLKVTPACTIYTPSYTATWASSTLFLFFVSLLLSLYFRGLFRLASFLFLLKLLFLNVGLNLRICSPNKRHLPRKRCRLRRNSSALPRLLPREFILPKSIQCQCKSTPQISLTHSRNVNRISQCCPTSANCTGILLQNPQCANQSWNLYDNSGYFCCEKGLIGYASTTDSDGCASPGYAFQSGEVVLAIISTGIGMLPCSSVEYELMFIA
jgi:hypothetical protein